jgi:hypothetical protein
MFTLFSLFRPLPAGSSRPPAERNDRHPCAGLFFVLFATTVRGGALPIPPDAWVNRTNLKPQYFLSLANEYPNLGGVIHRAVLFGDARFDPRAGVFAYDREDGPLPVFVTGRFDPRRPGVQHLVYTATDSGGRKVSFTRTLVVLPPGCIARFDVTGRFGPHDTRLLDETRCNRLSTDLTFLAVDVTAPPEAEYAFREIRRPWRGDSGVAGQPCLNPGTHLGHHQANTQPCGNLSEGLGGPGLRNTGE